MRFTIFYSIVKINNLGKLYETEMKLSRFCLSGRMMVIGTSSKLFMFIVTLCIIFHLNQALPMKNMNVDIKCGNQMMNNLFSRIQMSPLIFQGRVIEKKKMPDPDNKWKLVALVEVNYIYKDIFTPQLLRKLRRVWIGVFSDLINTTCMGMLRNESSYIFFGSPISKSSNSFQSLYVPLRYSIKQHSDIQILQKKKMEQLSISKIYSQKITVDGKIDVQCHADGYPKPSYFWYRNKVEPIQMAHYNSNHNSRISYSVEGIRSVLHIEHVEKSDEGYYTCQARNIYEIVISTFRLQVFDTEESRRKCQGQRNYCVYGVCSKDKITCECQDGYVGRRCNFDSFNNVTSNGKYINHFGHLKRKILD